MSTSLSLLLFIIRHKERAGNDLLFFSPDTILFILTDNIKRGFIHGHQRLTILPAGIRKTQHHPGCQTSLLHFMIHQMAWKSFIRQDRFPPFLSCHPCSHPSLHIRINPCTNFTSKIPIFLFPFRLFSFYYALFTSTFFSYFSTSSNNPKICGK